MAGIRTSSVLDRDGIDAPVKERRCGRRTPSAAFAPAICAPSRSGDGCRPGGRYQFSGYQERCQGAFLIAAERIALRIIDVYVHRPAHTSR